MIPSLQMIQERKPIALKRGCVATVIPQGDKRLLAPGEWVTIIQTLGGTFTIRTDNGALARIDGSDADALGLEVSPQVDEPTPVNVGPFDMGQVMERLKTVFDPEIPVNIVELGLIYLCKNEALPGGGHRVDIEMSMTAPGCGMGDVLKEDVRARLQTLPGVSQVNVEIVWNPPWDSSRMSEAARLQLGWL
jgi:probable FeS assembly SUF system protein SufT